jgi:hypothetical protein
MRCIVTNGMTTSGGSKVRAILVCGLACMALAGCQQNTETYGPVTPTAARKPELDLSADRGVPVPQPEQVDAVKLASSRSLGARPNPWALMPAEVAFDQSETSSRLLDSQGGFVLEVVPTLDDPEDAAPVYEPVPNWRLSGVLIGSGVMALLDTGPTTYEIRPGMQIPGTEWRVVAIDSDRALLAREGNKLPKEFYVGLSGPITGDGVTVAGGGTGGNAGGTTGGGGNPRGGRGGIGG